MPSLCSVAGICPVLGLLGLGFAQEVRTTSPNGQVEVRFHLDATGRPTYAVTRQGRPVIESSHLGITRDDADFSSGLTLVRADRVQGITDRYEILTAKRRHNVYRANRRTLHLNAPSGRVDLVFQVSNDGVVFRYEFPDPTPGVHQIVREASTFRLPSASRAWLQPHQPAKTGFGRSNPAYEEFYEKDIPVGKPSPNAAGWVFPALFRVGSDWVALSEGTLSRGHCASHLVTASPDGEYAVAYPDLRESKSGGPVLATSALPWRSPWRIITVGSLKQVTESMLGVDVADPAKMTLAVAPVPGKAAWSWPLLGDGSANFNTQHEFIDYAARMHWRYVLIDALWDTQIGYERTKDLVDYAATKGVKILVWYNSAGDWNETPQSPRGKLVTREGRLQEFDRLRQMGIAGLKIDFFGADGQSMIEYYLDILEDAAKYGFLLNFHGATLPRGWQRTYPNLMTMEAIKGEEYVTFDQRNADQQPTHAAMLPFTRNLFDPMDFTPVVLDRVNGWIQRRTTSGYELALSVIFTSGIQHYAEVPRGMAKAPEVVQDFLRRVPSVWDDSRFLAGEPGKFVVMARRGEGRWYLSAINGQDTPETIQVNLRELGRLGIGKVIRDGRAGNLSFMVEPAKVSADGTLTLTLGPKGGAVVEFAPR